MMALESKVSIFESWGTRRTSCALDYLDSPAQFNPNRTEPWTIFPESSAGNFHFAIASLTACHSILGPESIAMSFAEPLLPMVRWNSTIRSEERRVGKE